MSDLTWNVDQFCSDLTGTLMEMFSVEQEENILSRGVVACAEMAEGVCSGRRMACGPGCPHCCVLNVAILLPEGMLIADWLRYECTSEELSDLRERLSSHINWGRWMDDEERIARKVVCPLLDTGRNCFIHPVRPLACRGVASLDRESCRRAFDPIITDSERLVPADLLRRSAFDGAFSALAQTLKNRGLDDRSIELGTGILAFLEHPEYRDIFLSGGKLPSGLWA